MMNRRLDIFPILMALYLPVAFIVTYVMAVTADHVKAGFPYISDTGTIPPESCVFAQLLNIYAALSFWCMYLRYKQVRWYYKLVLAQGIESNSRRSKSIRRKKLVNKACLIIGFIAALGISVVGNFQEDNLLVVHLLGASMAFGGAGLYIWIQAFLSYKMKRLPMSRSCCLSTRMVLSVMYGIAAFIMLLTTKLSLDKFTKPWSEIKNWTPDDPGYTEHLFATIAEWVMAVISSAYFLTFTGELKAMQAKMLVTSNSKCHSQVGHISSMLENGEFDTTNVGGLTSSEQPSTDFTNIGHECISRSKQTVPPCGDHMTA